MQTEPGKHDKRAPPLLAVAAVHRQNRRLEAAADRKGEEARAARGTGRSAMAARGGRLREPVYVAYNTGGATTMKIYKNKRIAIKAAAEILRDRAADVKVGPMVHTREGVLEARTFAA